MIFPTQGSNLRFPAVAGGFFTAEPPGKPSAGLRAASPCLRMSGLTSLPSGAWCLVLFHSLSCLSCACCCVSASQLGSCQDKPAGASDPCQLASAQADEAVSRARHREIRLPRVTWEPGSENEEACSCLISLFLFPSSTGLWALVEW